MDIFEFIQKLFLILFCFKYPKQYRQIASHLNKLKAYPNGQMEAKTLTACWCEHHKTVLP